MYTTDLPTFWIMQENSLQTTMMSVEIGDCSSYTKEYWYKTEWGKKRSREV